MLVRMPTSNAQNKVNKIPDFEPVQENRAQSPNSQELASYEAFSRQELPRVFRRCLEAAVSEETDLLEEKFRSRLVDMIKDCQDQVLVNYQSKIAAREATAINLGAQPMTMIDGAPQISSTTSLADFFQQPPQQRIQYSVPDLVDIQLLSSHHELSPPRQFSESGYASMSNSQPLTRLRNPNPGFRGCGCYNCHSLCLCPCHRPLDFGDSTSNPESRQIPNMSGSGSFRTSTILVSGESIANFTTEVDSPIKSIQAQSGNAKPQTIINELSLYDAEEDYEIGIWRPFVNDMPFSDRIY